MRTFILISLTILFSCAGHKNIKETGIQNKYTASSPAFSRGTTSDSSIFLSWVRADSITTFICISKFEKGNKTPSDTLIVSQSDGVDNNPENMPKLAFNGDKGILMWGTKAPNSKNRYAGKVYYAISSDGGKTWSEKIPLVNDTTSFDQRYFDIEVDEKGEFFCSWLDSRGSEESEGSSLYFGKLSEGLVTEEKRITPSVCPCCRTDLFISESNDFYIAYRQIFNDSIRDMACVASFDNASTFTSPRKISADNWVLNGCPHTGPSIAADEKQLYFSWYTMGGGEGVFQCSGSFDLDYFSFRENLSKKALAKHPQQLNTKSGLLVVWDEPALSIEGSRLGFRLSTKNKNLEWTEEGSGSYTFPVLKEKEDIIYVAFTSIEGDDEQVKIVSYTIQDLSSKMPNIQFM